MALQKPCNDGEEIVLPCYKAYVSVLIITVCSGNWASYLEKKVNICVNISTCTY